MYAVFMGRRVFCYCGSRGDADVMVRVLITAGYGFVWIQQLEEVAA